jgi:integrase
MHAHLTIIQFYTHSVPTSGIMGIVREALNMQSGHIRVNGRWWLLKVREWVVKDGVKRRVDSYKKLREVRHNEGGAVPNDVQALADLELAKVNIGHGQGQSADSVKSYLESYIAAGIGSKTRRKLRDVTVQSYRRDYNVIKEFIPDMQMRQVRTPDINRIFDALIEDDGNTVRAQSAYNNIKNFLSGAFRSAVGAGMVDFNPVTAATSIGGNEANTHAYSLEEVHSLMSAVDNHTAQAAFMVLTFTGLRSEELKGLRWSDYDREKGVLNIHRTIVHGKLVEDTKTSDSKAPVPVIGIVKKYLDAHLERNTGTGYIFHAPESPEQPVNFGHLVWDIVIPATKEAGVKWHGLHAFRRGLSSVLHDLEVPELNISHILRHSTKSSKSVAGRHYIKPSLERMRAALEKVEAKYKAIEKKGRR